MLRRGAMGRTHPRAMQALQRLQLQHRPRVQKREDVVSIAPYAEKYASQGAENGHFPICIHVQKRSLAFEDR